MVSLSAAHNHILRAAGSIRSQLFRVGHTHFIAAHDLCLVWFLVQLGSLHAASLVVRLEPQFKRAIVSAF